MAFVTERRESVQYDGTNGLFIGEEFLDPDSYTVTSDTGSQLVLTDFEGSRKTILLHGWCVRDSSRSLMWHGSDGAYQARWITI